MVTLSGWSATVFSTHGEPVLLGLAEHAGDEVDIDLREAERARLLVRGEDLRRPVRPPVQFEDLVAEVLDAQAETRHAHAADGRQLGLGQRARLALERDLFGIAPRGGRAQTGDQPFELTRGQKRRGAAAEIDEIHRPPGNGRQPRVELPLARQHVEIVVDLLRVLVGVDAEVAEVAALPAERDVEVHPERHARHRRRVQRRPGVALDVLLLPDGERRVGGDEIAANLGLILDGHR